MVMEERRARDELLPCGEFAAAAGSHLCECTYGLARLAQARICPGLATWWAGLSGWSCDCGAFVDRLLLGMGAFAALFWLVVPRSAWDEWLCGYGMLALAITCFALAHAQRQCARARSLEPRAQGEHDRRLARVSALDRPLPPSGCACATPSSTRPNCSRRRMRR